MTYPSLPQSRALPASILLMVAIASCSGPQNGRVPTAPLDLTSLVATSQTSLHLEFTTPVGTKAALNSSYVIQDAAGQRLEVLAAYVSADGKTVDVATAPQAGVPYVLDASQVNGQAGQTFAGQHARAFTGSTRPAPVLSYAAPLNNSELLLEFTDPATASGALLSTASPAAFKVTSGSLQLLAARLTPDRTGIILKTSPQADAAYQISAAPFTSQSGALIQPGSNTTTFVGLATNDQAPPQLMRAAPLSNTTVQVQFSEPVSTQAADASLYTILDGDGTPLPVVSVVLNEFRTIATLTTLPQDAARTYTVQGRTFTDQQNNPVTNKTVSFKGMSIRGPVEGDTTPPRLSSVGSSGVTTVIVTFSEPVKAGQDSAENPAHYRITGVGSSEGSTARTASIRPQSATLTVTAAKLLANRTAVELTTLPQSDIQYQLQVTNVSDLAGNQIAPPSLGTQPSAFTFTGTAASGPGTDTDGDGLTDAEEQRGWVITIRKQDGTTFRREVTSDPTLKDTDGDAISDKDEKTFLTDPRLADTDADGLTDDDELSRVYSTPNDQDTDRDGLADGLEHTFFKTSALLADTDGDQFSDADEVASGNRNPRIADLPRLQIKIGDISLTLNETFSYTDATGATREVKDSTSSTLEQSTERRYGTSDSSTLTSAIEASVKTGIEAKFPEGFGASVETEFKGSEQREYNTTTSRESSASATEAFNKSFEKSESFQSSSEVTRTVTDAAMRLGVTLGNDSNTAFTVRNLEITAMEQNPFNRSVFTPVATLIAEAVQLPGAESTTYNLGPLVPELGPFIFKNAAVFPSTIENLLKNPHGLVFRVANYNITDEAGRNFAFTSREAFDRTAEIVIDYGDGRVLRRRVATTSEFDATGKAKGITMKYALQDILGVDYATGTVPYASGQVLTRVGSVSNQPGSHKAWTILSQGKITNGTDFDEIILRAGDSYSLAFLEDVDQDGLLATEEYLYGSSDNCVNSDGNSCASAAPGAYDTLSDVDEIRVGWRVRVVGRTEYQAFSDPRRADSDNDTLLDDREKSLGTDPRKRDSDDDGLSDSEEVNGFTMRYKGAAAPTDGVKTNPLNPDTDGDGLSDGFERKIGSNPNVADATKFTDTDQDGVSDYDETNGFSTSVNGSAATFKSYNDDADSDNDGLPDLLEHLIKSNPLSNDTDGDGLTDRDEFKPSTFSGYNAFVQACSEAKNCSYAAPSGTGLPYGTSPNHNDTDRDGLNDKVEATGSWSVEVTGASGSVSSSTVTSDATVADTDGDGWNDKTEYERGTDPRKKDTDGDGTNDPQEASRCVDTTCTSPLVMDQKVTVEFVGLRVLSDGDDGDNPGDFKFQMVASVPGQDGNFGSIIGNTFSVDVPNCTDGQGPPPCRYVDGEGTQVAISGGQTLNVSRSVSFIRPWSQSMKLYYFVQELDSGGAQYTFERQREYSAGSAITPGTANTGAFSDYHQDDDCTIFNTECDSIHIEVKMNVTVQ